MCVPIKILNIIYVQAINIFLQTEFLDKLLFLCISQTQF